MNTNIILDGVSAILNQLIATAVAEAIKPLKERIAVLEAGEWTKTQHIVVKEIQPLQDRVIALEIQQDSLALACQHIAQPLLNRLTSLEINQTLVSSAKVDFNEAIRDVLDGYNFINRNDVVDLVDKVVENAIDAYDFSDSIDWDNKIEEGINNYDFSDIIQEMLPDELDKDVVQQMIDESLDNLSISRN
jgi:hypothetical protein